MMSNVSFAIKQVIKCLGLSIQRMVLNNVKQGDVMSPLLFNLFINDLPEHLGNFEDTPVLNNKFINCLIYADDLVIFSKSAPGLQKSLDNLSDYCNTWKLEINLNKTKVMLFQPNGHLCKDRFTLNDATIDCVNKYKYLGINIVSSGSYKATKEALCDKSKRAVFKIKKTLANCDVSPELCLYLFDSLIKPIALHVSEIWGVAELSHQLVKNGYQIRLS